mmetsp:Transcript_3201/g.4283  ORF Transcript_3201/g.4283 Transcript_3201/m.4283 type:complete len:290 (-) Transcript_3201:323-1192(-)|eukprot:jgi/Bigna1/49541/estExt_Genewise1.C_510007
MTSKALPPPTPKPHADFKFQTAPSLNANGVGTDLDLSEYGLNLNSEGEGDGKGCDVMLDDSLEETESEFPSLVGKTYEMVDDPHTDHIICWAEDGNGFLVKNSESFCAKILPSYFRTKRFRSFVRNLNMYGFRSRKQAREGHYRFKHPQFRKGKKHLLMKIRKKTTQKSILNDLRSSIKELSKNYAKLAKSHARLEGVVQQYTKILPIHMLQTLRNNLDNGNFPTKSSGNETRSVTVKEEHESSGGLRLPSGMPTNIRNIKGDNDIFGAPMPFSFDTANFGWPLLNPQS